LPADGTGRRLRRGAFSPVGQLTEAIEIWTEHWNDGPRPFAWHKSAQEIITTVHRGRASLTQVKSATRHQPGECPADRAR
jgi:hypothetical protein